MNSAKDELFRLLVDSVRDYAIFLLDRTGRIASWNTGAERIKGYRADEIIGRSLETFYPEADVRAGKCAQELETALRDGRVEDEGWRIRKDGTRFWANVVITSLFREGDHVGFAKVTRDLSERRNSEETLRRSEEQARLLLDSMTDYEVCILDPTGTIMTWNAGAERIKGYRASEIVGRSFTTCYPPEDIAAGKCDLELLVAARDGRFEDEGFRLRKDGSRFWANVVITRLDDPRGELRGFAKVTRDLTDRRAAEEERLRLAQSQEALRLRDEFLSIASHELKTPLTALKLQAQSLLMERSNLAPKIVAKLERIENATRRLTALVEALLDVSRIASGRFTLQRQRIDFGTVVREAVERQEARIETSRASVRISLPDAPVMGEWDPLRLDQVITNLIDNALKYGAGSAVDVSVVPEPERVTLLVEDRGPGVLAGDQERIFQRFERAVSMDHFGGLGLGLYVCRQIVQSHGGAIAARNREGGGATFAVTLPRHHSEGPG